MKSRWPFLIIITGFLLGMNYIVLHRFLNEYAFLVALCLAVLFPVGNILEQTYATRLTSYLYRLGVAWFESTWLLLVFVGLAYFIEWIGLGFALLDAVVIALWLLFTILGVLYAQTWKTTDLILEHAAIKEPVSFVQLTDVHAFGACAKEWVASVIERARRLKPDFIVMTGDILDVPSIPKKDVLPKLVPVPIFYSLGNHEFYFGDKIAEARVKPTEIKLLRDEAVLYKGVNIIGLDDSPKNDFLKNKVKKHILKNAFNLLLFHRPAGMRYAAEQGVDLQLSGHTHGGVNFPMHIFVSAVYGKFYKGLHKIKSMWLYTSNGSGTFNWPLRLFNPQEIVRVTLLPKK